MSVLCSWFWCKDCKTMTTVEGSDNFTVWEHSQSYPSFVFINGIMLPVNTCIKSERWGLKSKIFVSVLSSSIITQSNNNIRAWFSFYLNDGNFKSEILWERMKYIAPEDHLLCHNLNLSRVQNSVKFSRASSRVIWLNGEWTNFSSTIFFLIGHQFPNDEDRDGSQNIGVLAI